MRHEEKFICPERELTLLDHRLRYLTSPDSHQAGDHYHIRSLYLDTADDRMYRESLDGVDLRSKYRIRFYNMQDDLIRLERKDTVGRLKRKHSVLIGRETVDNIISGKELKFFAGDHPDHEVFRELCMLWQSEGLRPVIIVDYIRTAYLYPAGNVRITFDRNISCTLRTSDLMDPHAVLYPIMPMGMHILEVKYDGMLPGFLAKAIDMGNLKQVSFSKYAYSRIVTENNGRACSNY